MTTSQPSTYPQLTEASFRTHATTDMMSPDDAERAVALSRRYGTLPDGAQWVFRLALLFQEAVTDGKVTEVLPQLEGSVEGMSDWLVDDSTTPYEFFKDVRSRVWRE